MLKTTEYVTCCKLATLRWIALLLVGLTLTLANPTPSTAGVIIGPTSPKFNWTARNWNDWGHAQEDTKVKFNTSSAAKVVGHSEVRVPKKVSGNEIDVGAKVTLEGNPKQQFSQDAVVYFWRTFDLLDSDENWKVNLNTSLDGSFSITTSGISGNFSGGFVEVNALAKIVSGSISTFKDFKMHQGDAALPGLLVNFSGDDFKQTTLGTTPFSLSPTNSPVTLQNGHYTIMGQLFVNGHFASTADVEERLFSDFLNSFHVGITARPGPNDPASDPTNTPEPSTITLLISGGLTALVLAWRRKKKLR